MGKIVIHTIRPDRGIVGRVLPVEQWGWRGGGGGGGGGVATFLTSEVFNLMFIFYPACLQTDRDFGLGGGL